MRGRKSSKCRDVIICHETISNKSEAFQCFSNDVCGMKLTVLLSKMCTKVFPQEITKNSWRILSLKVATVTKVKRDDTQYIHITHGWTQDENQAIHVTDPYFLIHIHSWSIVWPVSSKKSRGQKERLFAVCTGIFWPFETTRNQIKSTVLTKRCVCIR